MADQSLTITQEFDQSPAVVFAAVNNVRGWWDRNLQGTSEQVGDSYIYDVPGIHHSEISVIESVPDSLVAWHVDQNKFGFLDGDDEWTNTSMRFEISSSNGKTQLRFTHVGLVPTFDCWDACHAGWDYYITQSLRQLITTGKGTPNEMPEQIESLAALQNQ